MKPTVSLQAVVQEMALPGREARAYLNGRTGELITITQEEIEIIEQGDDINDLPEWQRDVIRETQRVLHSEDFLPLPSEFDIDEYAIMKRFCYSQEDDRLLEDLLDQLRGSGAFRRFKDAVHRHGIVDAWYRFRQTALEDIAVEWLEAHDIPYTWEGL